VAFPSRGAARTGSCCGATHRAGCCGATPSRLAAHPGRRGATGRPTSRRRSSGRAPCWESRPGTGSAVGPRLHRHGVVWTTAHPTPPRAAPPQPTRPCRPCTRPAAVCCAGPGGRGCRCDGDDGKRPAGGWWRVVVRVGGVNSAVWRHRTPRVSQSACGLSIGASAPQAATARRGCGRAAAGYRKGRRPA
jgi:hypothetical protein